MTSSTPLPSVTDAEEILSRYERAKALSQGILKSAVPNALLFPVWIKETNSFWYERQLADGKEFRLVSADTASNEPAFNHEILAKTLAEASGERVDVHDYK